ncbi:hypothetical protein HDR61_03070 [bacterium]|nr:hypothetical protein [bacterium]
MDIAKINIANWDKVELLQRLINNADGVLVTDRRGIQEYSRRKITYDEAKCLWQSTDNHYFDSFQERPLKVDLSGKTMDATLYVRDNSLAALALALGANYQYPYLMDGFENSEFAKLRREYDAERVKIAQLYDALKDIYMAAENTSPAFCTVNVKRLKFIIECAVAEINRMPGFYIDNSKRRWAMFYNLFHSDNPAKIEQSISMDITKIDITNWDKIELLQCLINGANGSYVIDSNVPLEPVACVPGKAVSWYCAGKIWNSSSNHYFDYYRNVPLKVDLSGDVLDAALYVRANGLAALATALKLYWREPYDWKSGRILRRAESIDAALGKLRRKYKLEQSKSRVFQDKLRAIYQAAENTSAGFGNANVKHLKSVIERMAAEHGFKQR